MLDGGQQSSRKRQSAKQPEMRPRRFPPPWSVEAIEAGFKVIDSNGQSPAYVYGHADKRDAETAKENLRRC